MMSGDGVCATGDAALQELGLPEAGQRAFIRNIENPRQSEEIERAVITLTPRRNLWVYTSPWVLVFRVPSPNHPTSARAISELPRQAYYARRALELRRGP
jgi:hypothetical protein